MSDQVSSSCRKSWTVSADQNAVRLDAYVRTCLPHLSRREAEKAIKSNVFFVNGRPAKKGQRLASGDILSFLGSDVWLAGEPVGESQLDVPIVYEDPHLLVLDKPAGMDTHGFSARHAHTLANFLAGRRPETSRIGRSRWEPGLAHRLDRETSGLVLVAMTQRSFEQLRLQFRRRAIKKKYWALAWGETDREGSIAYPIAHDSHDKRRMSAIIHESTNDRAVKSWKALTRFRTLAVTAGVSLLEIEMETGVTHQIRVHLAAIEHPIVGDTLYGGERAEDFGLKRQFLHAYHLALRHPQTGRELVIESPLPPELYQVLDRLGIKGEFTAQV
jgi:23S rRNA pseudouridine1911/1915/1917 synthase